MLEKTRQVNYSPASGLVHFESDQMMFQEGDNVAVIQLRGELNPTVSVVLRIKPTEGELIEVEGKPVPYKSIAREFKVPTDKGTGIYQCQIVMSYTYETNVSEVFQYEVKESLK